MVVKECKRVHLFKLEYVSRDYSRTKDEDRMERLMWVKYLTFDISGSVSFGVG
jgi:hypothetical protein